MELITKIYIFSLFGGEENLLKKYLRAKGYHCDDKGDIFSHEQVGRITECNLHVKVGSDEGKKLDELVQHLDLEGIRKVLRNQE